MSNPDSSHYNAKAGEIVPFTPTSPDTVQDVAGVQIENGRAPLAFTIALGDITSAPHEAIVCPTDNTMGAKFSAGVSGAIERAGGDEPFVEAQKLVDLNAESAEGSGLPFGASVAVTSGKLALRGIKYVVFTSVFPPSGAALDCQSLSLCVTSAALEANRVGATSLAVPAVSSGQFGMLPLKDSCMGVLVGVRRYSELSAQDVGVDHLGKISLVLYYRPTLEAAEAVQELLREVIDEHPNLDCGPSFHLSGPN